MIISHQAVGARLSVQERAGLPLVDEYGVDLAPGALTSLALQVVNITRYRAGLPGELYLQPTGLKAACRL